MPARYEVLDQTLRGGCRAGSVVRPALSGRAVLRKEVDPRRGACGTTADASVGAQTGQLADMQHPAASAPTAGAMRVRCAAPEWFVQSRASAASPTAAFTASRTSKTAKACQIRKSRSPHSAQTIGQMRPVSFDSGQPQRSRKTHSICLPCQPALRADSSDLLPVAFGPMTQGSPARRGGTPKHHAETANSVIMPVARCAM